VRRRVELRAPFAVTATEIEASAFAPFGDVVRTLQTDGRNEWSSALGNVRANARISLYTSAVRAVRLPVELSVMERHPHSFQTFIPLDTSRYPICVAPNGAGDLPALDALRAFVVGASGPLSRPHAAPLRRARWRVDGDRRPDRGLVHQELLAAP
jgi:ureidoglycolate lyase